MEHRRITGDPECVLCLGKGLIRTPDPKVWNACECLMMRMGQVLPFNAGVIQQIPICVAEKRDDAH